MSDMITIMCMRDLFPFVLKSCGKYSPHYRCSVCSNKLSLKHADEIRTFINDGIKNKLDLPKEFILTVSNKAKYNIEFEKFRGSYYALIERSSHD